ncbi:hypothetical protein HN630_04665 [archaeon]|jgi:hypothetical protein|nr:hypothetical protein [archaeon]MBT7239251.1 hypothetical protein [archaeon]MBT7568172.1 hypothetical protein [archaeon]
MNKKGEASPEEIIKAIFAIIIILPLFGALFGALNDISHQSENTEIQKITNEKNLEIENITNEKEAITSERDDYKSRYEQIQGDYDYLINTSVTKNDVNEIHGEMNSIKNSLDSLHNKTSVVNQNINHFYDIRQTYIYYTISVVINFAIPIVFVLDWTLFNFSITVKITKKMNGFLGKLKTKLKKIFFKEKTPEEQTNKREGEQE